MDSNNLKATGLPFKIIIIFTRKFYRMNGQKYICQSQIWALNKREQATFLLGSMDLDTYNTVI